MSSRGRSNSRYCSAGAGCRTTVHAGNNAGTLASISRLRSS
ncbi:hypothetical protein OESDEN_25058 [Oesophagostomum dentatum]|uniref:Uncharacterized protein n=1 Tax=Oesophagostomum dentatum TaxID=61180 RepID=A0A0B1RWA4_OESDE|nr:hypothetical protein OESDEN_25058 [Oesophagostomum dentatum]